MELSVFSSPPCRKDAKILLRHQTSPKTAHLFGRPWHCGAEWESRFAKMLTPSFSIQLHLAKCGNCACLSATLPSTALLEKVCSRRQVSIGALHGSLFFQKNQRESDDTPKFNVFTGWFDFCMEVSDSSFLPCRKDTTATIKPWRKLARLFGRPWDCLAEVITQKGWLKAINRPLRTKMWVRHMLIVQGLDVDLPPCDKPKCRNSRKPSVQLDYII